MTAIDQTKPDPQAELKEKLLSLAKTTAEAGKHLEAAHITVMALCGVTQLPQMPMQPQATIEFLEVFRSAILTMIAGMTKNEADLHLSVRDGKSAKIVTQFGGAILEVLKALSFAKTKPAETPSTLTPIAPLPAVA